VDFIRKIKGLGYKVKLDTNGTRPDVLRLLYAEKLLDFVAMDIKSHLDDYDRTTNSKVDIERIRLSVDLIRNSGIDYEFRTTAVPGFAQRSGLCGYWEVAGGVEKNMSCRPLKTREKILNPRLLKKTKGKKLDLEKNREKILKSISGKWR